MGAPLLDWSQRSKKGRQFAEIIPHCLAPQEMPRKPKRLR
jgi:hypothetical protein